MKRLVLLAAILFAASRLMAASINVDFAYHDDGDGTDDRATEKAPGTTLTFLGNGKTEIPDGDPVTLYVMTAQQFAGDADEQVFARWWNGQEEQWIMGSWVTNLVLRASEDGVGSFHGQPFDGEVTVDLWKIEVGAELTMPGENFYVIQLKGWAEAGSAETYLTRDMGESSSGENNVNQDWTTGPYFNHDWSVKITP